MCSDVRVLDEQPDGDHLPSRLQARHQPTGVRVRVLFQRSYEGNTAAHYAVVNNNCEVLSLLQLKRALMNIRNCDGKCVKYRFRITIMSVMLFLAINLIWVQVLSAQM